MSEQPGSPDQKSRAGSPELLSDKDVAKACRNIVVLFCLTCVVGLTLRHVLGKPERIVYPGDYTKHERGDWPPDLFQGRQGFFLEIGSRGGSAATRSAEHLGWHGVCADPFPHDGAERSCKLVEMPVAGRNGTQVRIPHCADRNVSVKRLLRHAIQGALPCPVIQRTAVGIVELLEETAAPRTIDLASLDAEGFELEILEAFPFAKFCVREWIVSHQHNHSLDGIRHILSSDQSCTTREGNTTHKLFAHCSCSKAPSLEISQVKPLTLTNRSMPAGLPNRSSTVVSLRAGGEILKVVDPQMVQAGAMEVSAHRKKLKS